MPKLPENVSIFVRFHFTLTIFLDCADELSASICRLPRRISYLKEQRDSDWEFAHDLEKDRLLFKTEIKTYREMNERKFCFSMFSLFILCCFREAFTQPLKRIKTQTKQIKPHSYKCQPVILLYHKNTKKHKCTFMRPTSGLRRKNVLPLW